MLTAAQVAHQLGLSARAVYDLAASGLLACYRLGAGGGALRFAPEDLEAYKARCRSTKTSAPAAGASTSTGASAGAAFAGACFCRPGGPAAAPATQRRTVRSLTPITAACRRIGS
ncbi:MAG: helix-turn-helix domain-containing protein [Rhodobiaceae bacterium]|nr:helix-turn-helix domain-containing protein [Rhodobiaceae bacterium]